MSTYENDTACVARALIASQGDAERAVFTLVAEAANLAAIQSTSRMALTNAAMAIARAEVAARAATAMADIAFDIDTIEPAHGIALELPNRRPAC